MKSRPVSRLAAPLAVLAITLAFLLPGGVQAETAGDAAYTPTEGQAGKDVVWVPTAQTLVDLMLDMAELQPGDRLVDLGSGDGRTVITAAKRGVPARGIEYNPDLVALSQRNAQAEGVAGLARFEEGDIFEVDFSEATVVTLFLLPELNMRLRPILLDMPPGTRVLSNTFAMEDWQPDATAEVGEGCTNWCRALKWVIPAKVAGTWQLGDQELHLTQTFQMLDGTLRSGDRATPIADGRLNGTHIEFTVDGRHYTGQIAGNLMQGTIDGAGVWSATR